MKIAIGCDHTALALKETIKNYLDSRMITMKILALLLQKALITPE